MTRHREAAAAMLIAVLASVAYLAAGTPEARAEWHYVTSGAALMCCAVWLMMTVRSPVAKVGLAWLAWEQLQVAACGIDSYGLDVPMGSGLCAVQYGNGPYLLALALALMCLPLLRKKRKPK